MKLLIINRGDERSEITAAMHRAAKKCDVEVIEIDVDNSLPTLDITESYLVYRNVSIGARKAIEIERTLIKKYCCANFPNREQSNGINQIDVLQLNNILTPNSAIITKDNIHELKTIVKDLGGFPLVARASNRKSVGIGIMKVSSMESLSLLLELLFKRNVANCCLQQYIEHDHHIRVFVLDNKVLCCLNHAMHEGEFRTNRKVGIDELDLARLKKEEQPKEITELAKEAVRAVDTLYGGVDIARDKSGNLIVFEVNYPCYYYNAENLFNAPMSESIIRHFMKYFKEEESIKNLLNQYNYKFELIIYSDKQKDSTTCQLLKKAARHFNINLVSINMSSTIVDTDKRQCYYIENTPHENLIEKINHTNSARYCYTFDKNSHHQNCKKLINAEHPIISSYKVHEKSTKAIMDAQKCINQFPLTIKVVNKFSFYYLRAENNEELISQIKKIDFQESSIYLHKEVEIKHYLKLCCIDGEIKSAVELITKNHKNDIYTSREIHIPYYVEDERIINLAKKSCDIINAPIACVSIIIDTNDNVYIDTIKQYFNLSLFQTITRDNVIFDLILFLLNRSIMTYHGENYAASNY